MTEEIKELLSIISDGQDSIQRQQLVNYITNLQKDYEIIYNENCKLREQHNINDISLLDELQDYKSRNEKAIEWCECVVNAKYTADKLPNGKITDMGYCLDLAEPLLNILQGGDE